MKFEIKWTPDERAMARRIDGRPMTDEDRLELKALLEKMDSREVCFACGSPWSLFTDPAGERFFVCWVCAKSA